MVDPATLLASARAELARLPSILDAHLRDEEEEEDFGARLCVVVEGGTTFAPIDPARWAEVRAYRDADPETALAAFRERRAATLAFLTAVSSARLRHTVSHPRLGTLSGMDLLAAWITHDRLHLGQLAATLARLGARRWAPLRVEYAGPIPYAERPVQ